MMYVNIETTTDNYKLIVQHTEDIYDFINRYNITDYDIWVNPDNISFWDIYDVIQFL